MSARRRRVRRNNRPGPLTWFLLALAGLVFALPLLFMVVGAFKPGDKVLAESGSWRALWPTDGSTSNLSEAVRRGDYLLLLRNSLVVATVVVVLGAVVNSMFGYALARLPFTGRRLLLGGVIALSVVPFQALAIPLLYLMSGWGWRNTFQALSLPFVANPFYVYLFYAFFRALPHELEEAARVDGAGAWRVFRSIAVPLARPAYATVGILSFLTIWGELLWPALVTDDIAVRTLPLGVSVFRSTPPVDQGVVLAFVLLTALPTLAVFLVLQRQFIASVARSGIRG